ncbi:pseudaminic acid cytidylyltransferase [Rapidithrix thailandica]|uniref:Pseudaminic acid cytidylyltransferase n=1 Tax=Rapidithrix thailandica TaxID=413964 RepID=A0AAW9S4A2_9BACT
MKKLAIIPARGGSKRIPRKNIKPFLGKPILAYSIESALKSALFDEVMVSTDDEEIAGLAKSHGAEVPFLRSKKNADDYATTAEVLLEVIEQYEQQGVVFDFACCIYPTAPLLTERTLQEALDKLLKGKYDTVFPIVPFGYPVWRGLEIDCEKVKMVWPEHLNSRSQDLPPVYHDAGQFYWLNLEKFKVSKQLFTNNSGSIVLSELQVQDIDNHTDWQIAELKYKLLTVE